MALIGLTLPFALIAAPAPAEPLCRDLKGLFTPCPEALTKTAQRRLEERIASLSSTRSSRAPGEAMRAAAPKPSPRAHVRLCRDTKGLFTPCPR